MKCAASILKSLEDLPYNKSTAMCFKCDHCSELHQVEKMKEKDCYKIHCSKARTSSRIHQKEGAGSMKVSNRYFSSVISFDVSFQDLRAPPPAALRGLKYVSLG